MSAESDFTIVESDEQRRFKVTVEGQEAYLTFARDNDRMWLLDTVVPLPSKGVGSGGGSRDTDSSSPARTGWPLCPSAHSFWRTWSATRSTRMS